MSFTLEQAYQILEVSPTATWEEVRQSYREMVKVWHPDRFQDDEKFKQRATRKVQDINEAYRTLEAYYQTPRSVTPPPIPEQHAPQDPPQPTNQEPQFWSRSADGLIAKIANGQPYHIFPCRMHGFDRYRQHLEVIPLYLWIVGCICLLSAFAIPILVVPAFLLIPASFVGFLWGKYERWKDPVKIRPDALLVTDAGLMVVQWVVEHTGTDLHAAKTVFTIPWENLISVKQKRSEMELHVQVETTKREFTVRPVLFEWLRGSKHTSYYRNGVVSRKEFKEAIKGKTASA